MLMNLIIGIASSLIASAIVGFLGNKVVSKQNSIILKLYESYYVKGSFYYLSTYDCGSFVVI